MIKGKIWPVIYLSFMCISLSLSILGCGGTRPTYSGNTIPQGTINVTSISPLRLSSPSSTRYSSIQSLESPSYQPGSINSGSPDYLDVTLKKISVETNKGSATIWSGSQALHLTGNGNLSLSNLTLTDIPTDPITAIKVTFDNQAYIQGTLTGTFGTIGLRTFYTKANGAYNAVSHSGGLASYGNFETGPAEKTGISLNGYIDSDGTTTITTNTNVTLDPNVTPTLTILFDLSRVLRFYNGLRTTLPGEPGGGVNPDDPIDKAYFFCHSIFSSATVAAFFGPVGQIQGYQTTFINEQDGLSGECVAGWMSLVFNPSGDLISGLLIGDDDNALTIAKGSITSVTSNGFHYNISEVDLSGFQKVSNLEGFDDVTWVQSGENRHGSARLTLKFRTSSE